MNQLTHITQLVKYLVVYWKEIPKSCVFCFPTASAHIAPDVRLLKYMVTRPLYNTIMINYIYYVQIDPYYRTGIEFDYHLESKTRILFFCFLAFSIHIASRCQTFKINGHEASVWYKNDDLHILSTNGFIILPNW